MSTPIMMQELVKGRDWTRELQALIHGSSNNDVSVLQQQKKLVEKILGSLTELISTMSSDCGVSSDQYYSGEVCHTPTSIHVGSPRSGDRRSVDSGQSSKRQPVAKNVGRGGYKRRKSSGSWAKLSPSTEDDYAWRKYGQKEILNSKFPRCYYRCTHKNDQGCKATKQTQRTEDETIMYRITYFGEHTCQKSFQDNVQNIFDCYSEDSNLINFKSDTPNEIYPSSPCPASNIKEENKEGAQIGNIHLGELPSIDWHDLAPIMRFDITNEEFPSGFNYSYRGMDMDPFSKYDDFESCFQP